MADFNTNPRPAPGTITGERGPENVNSVLVVADVKDEVLLWQPSANPIQALSKKLRNTRTTTQYRFDLVQQDQEPRDVVVATAATSAATSVVVNAGQGTRVPKYAVLLNLRTQESMYVSSMSTDTATVVRGIGSPAQDIVVGDRLLITRTVYEDGSAKGDLKSVKEDALFNYTEIVRTPYGVTGRQNETKLYGGKDLARLRKTKGIEHAKSLEFQLLFGTRHSMTGAGGHLVTFSGGIDYFLQSNIWNLDNTVPTERTFLEALEEGMKWGDGGNMHGPGKKFLFVSSRWLTEINAWAHDRLRLVPKDKTLGIEINAYDSPHGTVFLVKDPILDEYHPDRAYLLDLNHVRPARHQGRDTKIVKNIQANDVDGYEEEIRTDGGAEIELEGSHMLFKGLTV